MTMNARALAGTLSALLVLTGCPQTDTPIDSNNQEERDAAQDSSDMARQDEGDIARTDLRLTSISPRQGDVSGGTEVLINGAKFAAGATVRFGNVDATQIEVRSASQIAATTPGYDAASTVDVTVTNPDGESATLSAAFTYEAGAVETPLYCQLQAQSPLMTMLGVDPAPSLYAVVFAQDITPGAGQGAGVTAELGVGLSTDYENFTFTPMAYNVDKDGLGAGDLANDEYGAPAPVDASGSFRYVARVKTDGEWLYCDLDGSDNGVSGTQLGELQVNEAPPTPSISYCQIVTAMEPVRVETGQQTSELRARVFQAGVTEGVGQGAQIEAEIGYGAPNESLEAMTYTSLEYVGDADGLTPGDQANDDYAATLLFSQAGSYDYVARFRSSGEQEWFYCDLDGHVRDGDAFTRELVGSIEVTDPVEPAIGFCRTETSSVSVKPGEATPALSGSVYLLNVTEGAGQGAGLLGELVWGPAGSDPTTWTEIAQASYLEDTDGLNPGDQANDRYSVTITPAVEGEYEFAYRFSLDGGLTYTWCDTDGSSSDASSFDTDQLGQLEVASANAIDDCRLQFPVIANEVVVGQSVSVFAWLDEQGVTDVSDGDASLTAELWVGPMSADVVSDQALFEKIPMSFFSAQGAQDEFSADWMATAAGSYRFVVRASADAGATYSFCDLDGSSFEAHKAGAIVVHATAPDLIDYCHVFQGDVVDSLTDPDVPIFTVEVYEMGLTDGNNGGANSAQLEVQISYGAIGSNPALSAFSLPASNAYSAWAPAPFTKVNPSNPNNYEYQASPYTTTIAPVAHTTYDVTFRVREVGQGAESWVYCDNLSSSADFLINEVSRLEVLP